MKYRFNIYIIPNLTFIYIYIYLIFILFHYISIYFTFLYHSSLNILKRYLKYK